LCTANLPDPTIVDGSEHFNTVLWTGDGTSSRSFTGYNFTPDLLWAKQRSQAIGHALYDSVRGAGANSELSSNGTAAEGGGNNDQFGYLSSFDSDGFTAVDGTSSPNYYFNENSQSFVGWGWKAGGTAVSNTDGSITSQVSANTDAGFSIVSFDFQSTGNQTIGHGLSTKPAMIIMKSRDTSADAWWVYHESMGASNYLRLNANYASTANSGVWSTTPPTNQVFSVGSQMNTSNFGTSQIAYCFANTDGYLKAGSYTGNGSSNGTFVYTGFRPAFVMSKRTNSTGYWNMFDTDRDINDSTGKQLWANDSGSEASSTGNLIDILSNGFKCRGTGSDTNASGSTYIYLAFAENPFKYANAR
jgi:hypothetical protein